MLLMIKSQSFTQLWLLTVICVNTSFTDPGKEKELKSPAATKDKGNTTGPFYIKP